MRSIAADWGQLLDALGPLDDRQAAYARHSFYAGQAAAMSRLLTCPKNLHASGMLTVAVEQMDEMMAEILAELGSIYPGRRG